MRIVLVGPPGAGKGTQAQYLAKNLSIPHISTGDLFRANISQGTALGKQAQEYMNAGQLVPDAVTIGMATDRLQQPDAEGGFLLDGFPRNLGQAEALDGYLADKGVKLDAVLDLEVPEDEVVKRIAGRRICRNDSSHVFHVSYTPPKAAGVCDKCGGELYQRDDDSEDTVRKRLEVYHSETEPIIDFYKAQELVVTISALGTVEEVTRRAMEALGRPAA
ncbi:MULTISPECIES: adenylate kinase [Streptomycetaceae]|uniref:Adenylate kinase n=1 Tax=Streptantibioticus cattleyicolor (strain ATCC 35852 / DSM 46488 / JCM 4925 / NBRC 14057 / NRRL 8057) TaxID=1003195 RepID=F8JYH0_STREN|nr:MULTISPECIES: adenylate kinase [Streptomycetaceae]AEW95976.1 adenylate kinase [Streptantibioticus cattleyicolor NRRL 8057 = DSM 46488]MYS60509.1 adenylate kinase [Streptomyces sp. SID5468]CCB76309.1 adenylate kinase [Streptantibioticus cattleyicolor NRRL 8057 = DSM 46488]